MHVHAKTQFQIRKLGMYDVRSLQKLVKHYFTTKDFSIVASCELKFLQMPIVSNIEGYFTVFDKTLLHRIMVAQGMFLESKRNVTVLLGQH